VTDETRTFVIGRLKNLFQKAHEVALEIIDEMESVVKPGEAPVRIYERAQEKASQAGFAENFMGHGEGKVAFVGHGLGDNGQDIVR
jgi:Xaa-Pro aminopeptidase